MFYLCGSIKSTVYSQNPFNKRWRRELDRRVKKKWHLDIFNRRRRTRTPKVRTALSQSCPAGQTDNGQSFLQKSGQNCATGQDLPPSDRIFNKMYYSISNSKLIWANRGNKIQKLGYHQAIFTETSFCGSKNFIGKKSECSIEVGNFNR